MSITPTFDEISSVSSSKKSETQAPRVAARKRGPSHELTTEQRADMKMAFDSLDTNGTGWIRIEELRVAIRALGFEPKMEDIHAMIASIDKDGKGKISFDDFLHLMAMKMSEIDSKENILKAFRLMDVRDSGKIRFEDLKRIASDLGENLNDEELYEMITEADNDGSKAVTVEDFLKITKKFGGLHVLTEGGAV